MTQQEMHMELVKWMGWTQSDKGWWINPQDTNGGEVEPPALTLDWMHECEEKLTIGQRIDYQAWLDSFGKKDDRVSCWDLIHATKEQRLEAICRTLWPERF